MLAIYCRISGKKEEGTDVSISVQESKGKALAKKLNLPYTVFKDEGVSGTLSMEQRPSFKKIVQLIEANKVTAVYVYDQSRLERNTEERFKIMAMFKLYNIDLYTDNGLFDYNDIQKDFFGNMESLFNSYFVATTKKKVKEALLKKVQRGETRGIMPYGYMKDHNTKKMVINEEEAEVVKRIYDLSLKGEGTDSIAKRLTRDGVPTRYNKIGKGTLTTYNNATGEKRKVTKDSIKWAGNTVRNIITNPLYKGERKWNDEIYKVPAIVTPSYWKKVNDNLKNNRTYSGTKKTHNYLLRGLLRCGKCGKNYAGRVNKSSGDNIYYCASKRTDTPCGQPSINRPKIEAVIWNHLFVRNEIVNKLEKEYDNKDMDEVIMKLREEKVKVDAEVRQLNKQRDKAVELVIEGVLSKDEVRNKMDGIDKQLKGLANEKDRLIEEIHQREEAKKSLVKYKTIFERLTKETPFEERKKIVRDYVKEIKITVVHNRYELDVIYKIPILPTLLISKDLKSWQFTGGSPNNIHQFNKGEKSKKLDFPTPEPLTDEQYNDLS